MSPRAQTEKTTSELKTLRHREAELVRRMVIVSERRAFFPNEVSERQVEELSRKLDELRSRIATIEAQMPADLAW
jgi:cell division protein FtsB